MILRNEEKSKMETLKGNLVETVSTFLMHVCLPVWKKTRIQWDWLYTQIFLFAAQKANCSTNIIQPNNQLMIKLMCSPWNISSVTCGILVLFCIMIITPTFQEALILNWWTQLQKEVSFNICKVRFILVFALFVPPRRKLKDTDNLYYAVVLEK